MKATFVAACLLLLTASAQAADACSAIDPQQVLREVNARRQQGALCGSRGGMASAPPLAWSDSLLALAAQQARWLASQGRLAHTGPEGQTLRQRADAVGYDYARIAENVAAGQRSLQQVLDGWTSSEGHCVNLFDAQVSEMALACVISPSQDANRGGRPYWALLLARPARPQVAVPPR